MKMNAEEPFSSSSEFFAKMQERLQRAKENDSPEILREKFNKVFDEWFIINAKAKYAVKPGEAFYLFKTEIGLKWDWGVPELMADSKMNAIYKMLQECGVRRSACEGHHYLRGIEWKKKDPRIAKEAQRFFGRD